MFWKSNKIIGNIFHVNEKNTNKIIFDAQHVADVNQNNTLYQTYYTLDIKTPTFRWTAECMHRLSGPIGYPSATAKRAVQ